MSTGEDLPTAQRFVWCVGCGQGVRQLDWEANGDTCPGCGASVWSIFAWDYVRRLAPRLPPEPEPGRSYHLADYEE